MNALVNGVLIITGIAGGIMLAGLGTFAAGAAAKSDSLAVTGGYICLAATAIMTSVYLPVQAVLLWKFLTGGGDWDGAEPDNRNNGQRNRTK